MRGSHPGLWRCLPVRRSIPACAGEPISFPLPHSLIGVYPRVCGGAIYSLKLIACAQGLSPRVRGSRPPPRGACHAARSIPACAGEPDRRHPSLRRKPVYPRVCGGALSHDHPSKIEGGLSPRVRGSHIVSALAEFETGSIPACAGEPFRWARQVFRMMVYPRVCGGATNRTTYEPQYFGLSPRVRGSRGRTVDVGGDLGSIPACAGEPSPRLLIQIGGTVYPRVCGGAFRVPGWWGFRLRSIPACAGEPALRAPR